MADIDVAVFLVHSIGEGADWVERERALAENFRTAAERAGVGRIVYLGGLGDDRTELSEHLGSRHEVGRVLAAGPVECVELRAAAVIGSGSASFEMLRYLTEVLPVMVTPKWVRTECQPIAIRDVLRYLVAVVEHEDTVGGVLEIGGPDVLSYADMMATYAEVAGLPRRRLLPVPVLSPRLSSLWVGLVTPVPAQLARPLVDSLVNRVVVTDHRAEELFPFERLSLTEAIRLAITNTASGKVPTKFDDASSPVWQSSSTDPDWTGGTVVSDVRSDHHDGRPAFRVARDLPGRWCARLVQRRAPLAGARDRRPGRRRPGTAARASRSRSAARSASRSTSGGSPTSSRTGRSPSTPRCASRVRRGSSGRSTPTARAAPSSRPRGSGRGGLFGRAYWYGVLPFHSLVFPRLLHGIVQDAESLAAEETAPVAA